MKKNAVKYLMGFVMLLFASTVYADSFDDVINALKAQNAREVSKFLNSSVELTIDENEGVYSKQQAEIMIRNFLSQNPPKSIVIQHRGASGQAAKFAIASYETAQGKYRVYVFMKDNGGGMLVHEIRFEKE